MLVCGMGMSIWVVPLGWLLLHSQTDVTGKTFISFKDMLEKSLSLIPRPLSYLKILNYLSYCKFNLCCLSFLAP
jgi:hypothetical protein